MSNNLIFEKVKIKFNNINASEVIDLTSIEQINLGFNDALKQGQNFPELKNFFQTELTDLNNNILEKGFSSLRHGYYQLVNQPFLKTSIFPNTFAATVYFYSNIDHKKIIKYNANIGPMVNFFARKAIIPGTDTNVSKIIEDFDFSVRNPISSEHKDHFQAKSAFFNKVYSQNLIFYVQESIFDPAYPNKNPKPVKTTWAFLP